MTGSYQHQPSGRTASAVPIVKSGATKAARPNQAEISDFTRLLFSPVDNAVNLIAECSIRNYLTILLSMYERHDFDTLMPFFQQHRETLADGKFMPEFLHGFMFGIVITDEDCTNRELVPMAKEWCSGFAHDALYFSDVPSHVPTHSTKVGRNAPCPCGSGKKFKKCCGAPGRSVH